MALARLTMPGWSSASRGYWDPVAAHRGGARHDVDGLLEAPEDVLLDVRHAVLGADGLDERRRLLVREHRQVGPEVVLHLVVEPAVEKVVQVAQRGARRARGEVGRRDDLAQVKVAERGAQCFSKRYRSPPAWLVTMTTNE